MNRPVIPGRGWFITLEGSEGSGKSSQMQPLANALRQHGFDVLATREPGGTSIGDQVRRILMGLENTSMQPRTEVLLFQASRAQLVEEIILPALERGQVVLCDRFADSTYAYQGYGYQRDLTSLRQIVSYATGGLVPDLTLWLDLDAETGLRRRQTAGGVNRLDSYDMAFYQRVRQGYQELAAAEPQRWVRVHADQSPERVLADMLDVLLARLAV